MTQIWDNLLCVLSRIIPIGKVTSDLGIFDEMDSRLEFTFDNVQQPKLKAIMMTPLFIGSIGKREQTLTLFIQILPFFC